VTDPDEAVRQAMLRIELYWPEFLEHSEMKDSVVTRLSFYTTMIELFRETPHPDSPSQAMLINRLETLRHHFSESLAKEIIEDKLKE